MQKKHYYQYILIPTFLVLAGTLSAAVSYDVMTFPGTTRVQNIANGWVTIPSNGKAIATPEAGKSCQIVYQSGSQDQYFIPTNTQREWDGFEGNLPRGVSLGSCWCQNPGDIKTATTVSPGCNQNDITVCLGKGQSYTWSKCDVRSLGSNGAPGHYQGFVRWGENAVWDIGRSDRSGNIYVGRYPGGYTSRSNDWSVTDNGNLWGGAGTTVSAGTFQDRSLANQTLMKGVCPTGYHVPTAKEWCDTLVALGVGQTCVDNPGYIQGANSSVGTQVLGNLSQLGLGFNGNRSSPRNIIQDAGDFAGYWTSSPSPSRKAYVIFNVRSPRTVSFASDDRSDGFSVRCMRDAIETPR